MIEKKKNLGLACECGGNAPGPLEVLEINRNYQNHKDQKTLGGWE